MLESVRQAGGPAPAAEIRAAVRRQRERLTDLLTVSLCRAAGRLAPLIDIRHELELLLVDGIEHLRWCRSLYVPDVEGGQITGNVGRAGVDRSRYACNRSGCDYLQHIVGVSGFRLAEVHPGAVSERPALTAAVCGGLRRGLQRQCDPDTHDALPDAGRADSAAGLLLELIVGRGVSHGQPHFLGNCAAVWLADDPFRYRLLGPGALPGPDTRRSWPRRPCPDTALVPADRVRPVLERLCRLHLADGHIHLRSGSLHVFSGTVGLDLSSAGAHCPDFSEFLEHDAQFGFGLRYAG